MAPGGLAGSVAAGPVSQVGAGHFRFGDSALTLAEVGERLRLSRERIRQVEKSALARMRKTAGVIDVDESVTSAGGRVQSVAKATRLTAKTLAARKSIPRLR